MPELREDPLTGTLVVLAPGRAARPDTHRSAAPGTDAEAPAATRSFAPQCPFCPGNEHMTPPEVYRTAGGAADGPGWRVRVVPNLYPLVGDDVPGAHEVAVLSPRHDAPLGALSDAEAVEVFTVLRDRAAVHAAAGLAHAQPFFNYGKAAGASIEHPHAQLVALDFVPPAVERATGRFAAVADDLVARLLAADGEREHHVLRDHGGAVAWCAPASLSRYEVMVADPAAGARFDQERDDVLASMARATRRVAAAVAGALGDVPYNAVVHTAPATGVHRYHWYVRFTPRVSVRAGFEEGTGVLVNTVAPEAAAAHLREAAG
jgi:UDPglucose--hexose-1-phosphate uridylyltransferase